MILLLFRRTLWFSFSTLYLIYVQILSFEQMTFTDLKIYLEKIFSDYLPSNPLSNDWLSHQSLQQIDGPTVTNHTAMVVFNEMQIWEKKRATSHNQPIKGSPFV